MVKRMRRAAAYWMGLPWLDPLLLLASYGIVAILGIQLPSPIPKLVEFALVEAANSVATLGVALTALTVVITVTPGNIWKQLVARIGGKLVQVVIGQAVVCLILGGIQAWIGLGVWTADLAGAVSLAAGAWLVLIQMRILTLFYHVFAIIIEEKSI